MLNYNGEIIVIDLIHTSYHHQIVNFVKMEDHVNNKIIYSHPNIFLKIGINFFLGLIQ